MGPGGMGGVRSTAQNGGGEWRRRAGVHALRWGCEVSTPGILAILKIRTEWAGRRRIVEGKWMDVNRVDVKEERKT